MCQSGIKFSEFLESTPPSVKKTIIDLGYSESVYLYTSAPNIKLFCSNCDGIRIFELINGADSIKVKHSENMFYFYACRNCRLGFKIYALSLFITSEIPELSSNRTNLAGTCFKYGEDPLFGPSTPSRLIKLIGPDKDLFLKGRRCELMGIGIGAFAYYRRVVENQKNRILDQIIQISRKLNVNDSIIQNLEKAKAETQFKRSMDNVRSAIPESLLLNGKNPFVLLHSALSVGLHAESDEVCLDIAQQIRIVLVELAERMSVALKDDEDLKDAIIKLEKIQSEKEAKKSEKLKEDEPKNPPPPQNPES